jgi:hypothetical protein
MEMETKQKLPGLGEDMEQDIKLRIWDYGTFERKILMGAQV